MEVNNTAVPSSKEVLEAITHAAHSIKANDVTVVNFDGGSSLADYVVICHGNSTAHTQGIAERIELDLKSRQIYPLGVEGQSTGEWILIDYADVIVHIFTPERRDEFKLEELFQDFQQENMIDNA